MNSTNVVRADTDETGVRLRLWIDDEDGRHVTVAELRLGEKTMRHWVREIGERKQDADQYQLDLDQ